MKPLLTIFTLTILFSVQIFSTSLFPNNKTIIYAQGTGGAVQPPEDTIGATQLPGDTDGAQTTKLVNPLTVDDIQGLVAVLLGALVQIAIPFLVLAFMYVGFLFVAARGSGEKIAAARQAFFWTVVGTLMVLGAQLLSTILAGTIKQLTDIQ